MRLFFLIDSIFDLGVKASDTGVAGLAGFRRTLSVCILVLLGVSTGDLILLCGVLETGLVMKESEDPVVRVLARFAEGDL